MCQFAESLERSGCVCRPEPVLDAEQAAWKIGWNAYLAVECGAGHWDYKLFDEQFNVTKSGELEVVGCSINEVRDILTLREYTDTLVNFKTYSKSFKNKCHLENLEEN